MIETEIERPNYQTVKYQVGDLKDRKFAVLSAGPINYKEDGKFKAIDLSLVDEGTHWQATKASYHPRIPKYADDWFEFRDLFEGNDHTIKTRPLAAHVEGQLLTSGKMANRVVLYPNAFGEGIDLEVTAYNIHLLKKIIIRTPQTAELTFDFELALPPGQMFRSRAADKAPVSVSTKAPFDIQNKELLVGEKNPTVISPMRVWESSQPFMRDTGQVDVEGKPIKEVVQPPIELPSVHFWGEGGKLCFRKSISAEFLQSATYPVYTDDDTGLKSPEATGTPDNEWTNPANAYASDDAYATTLDDSVKDQSYTSFGFGIPAGATIDGIEATVEVKSSGAGNNVQIQVRSAVSGYVTKNQAITITETVYTLGGSSDLWGGSWSASDFSDANFILRLREPWSDFGNTVSVDHIQVKVYYTPPPPTNPTLGFRTTRPRTKRSKFYTDLVLD